MSKDKRNLGTFLIIIGLILVFGNLGIFHLSSFLTALAFVTAGIFFIKKYGKNNKRIWSFILAFGFFALATAVINPAMTASSLFLVMAFGFIFLYKSNQKLWWAIIPAGSLLSLSMLSLTQERFSMFTNISDELFFFGLAATFAYLFLKESKKWAIYPATALVSIPILGAVFSGGWLAAIILIVVGLGIMNKKQNSKFPPKAAKNNSKQ